MAATSPRTESNERTPSCPLEASNTDTLLDILSASNSLADLSALIHASPIAYNTFLLAKAAILRSVIENELGPTIRDAAILALTDRFTGEDFENRLASAVEEYRRVRLLPDDSDALWKWLGGLQVDTVVKMAKLNRTVLYFADLYGSIRKQYLQETLGGPQGWTMSLTERSRIAQALLRYQIIAHMNGGRWWQPTGREHDLFLVTVLPLFELWELEQTAEMDLFVCGLNATLRRCEKTPDGEPIPAGFPRNGYYSLHYYPNLEGFRAKLIEATNLDKKLLSRMKTNPELCKPRDGGSLFEWLVASHRYQRYSEDSPFDMLHLTAPRASAFYGDWPTCPPWAWVDAFDGQPTDRWGRDLVPERPHNDLWDDFEHSEMEELLILWRWLGLVFWDRDLAEELLKSKILERCVPGWLASYQAKCAGGNDGTESS